MFGFIIGTACLVGLVAVVLRGHRHAGHGGLRRYGKRMALRRLFERLDTTPGQEKAIVEAVDQFTESAHEVRSELKGSRTDVASALRDDHFDRGRVEELVTRHEPKVRGLTDEVATLLAKVHDVLDERQRGRLADWVESGPHCGMRHA